MAKMIGGVTKRSIMAAAKKRARLEADLDEVSAALRALEVERAALVVRRDGVVDELRALGDDWSTLARRAGVSRQALMKRAPAAAPDLDEPLPGL
uniref:Uncharacterized protein n=1 Tax=uncultured prokaryote TaxID=198431 RepID=A0A0H5QLD0_9ZZZZ|nr:hypothetical protein [uncultured prokaryote]